MEKKLKSILLDAGFLQWHHQPNMWYKIYASKISQIIKITPDGIRLEIYGRDNENILVITGGFEILKNTQC